MKRIKRAVAIFLFAPLVLLASLLTSVTAANATTVDCVDPSTQVLSHVNKSKTTTVVTLTKKLCKELNLGYAGWNYITPQTTGQWPQSLQGMTEASIQEPGAVTIVAPDVCGQRDLYYGYGTKPNPPSKLYGPNKPYEPPFLHQISKGPKTYNHDDPSYCGPQDVIMPKATASTICEIGQASAVLLLDNGMSSDEVEFVTKTSDGRTFTTMVASTKNDELMFPFTGTITVTVTANHGEQTYDVLEQTLTDEGCALPPTVVIVQKATIANVKCVDGTGTSLVTLDNTGSTVEGAKPNTDDMAAATTSFDVSTTAGYHKVITVPAGQVKTVKVPLVEDKKVIVTVKGADGKVLARKALTANCATPAVVPPTVNNPPATPPTTLAQTGVRENIAIVAGILLALGFLAVFGYDPIARYFSRRRVEA